MDRSSHMGRGEPSVWSKTRKRCAAAFTTLQERFKYVKASLIGQVKKAKAGDEKEATRAEMEAEKMQVDAADSAEHKKNQLSASSI